jgi:CRP-like cAMP-binding protein
VHSTCLSPSFCCASHPLSDITTYDITLQGLTAPQLRIVINHTTIRTYSQDAVIFSVGDPSSELYIIENGRITLSGINESGELVKLCERETYDFFGELTPHEGTKRPTRAHVSSNQADLRILTRESQHKLSAYPWFKPVNKRILRQASTAIAENLKNIPFLSHVGAGKLVILGELFQFTMIHKRENICKQGEMGDAFYILISGKAEVWNESSGSGSKRVTQVATLEAGAFFGEISLLQKIPRKASVTCTSDVSSSHSDIQYSLHHSLVLYVLPCHTLISSPLSLVLFHHSH